VTGSLKLVHEQRTNIVVVVDQKDSRHLAPHGECCGSSK